MTRNLLQYQFCAKSKISDSAHKILMSGLGFRNNDFSIQPPPPESAEDFFEVLTYILYELGDENLMDKMFKIYFKRDAEAFRGMDVCMMFDFCQYYLKSKEVYVKWFCTQENAVGIYDIEDPSQLSVYRIPARTLILADCEDEGVLLASGKAWQLEDSLMEYPIQLPLHQVFCDNHRCVCQDMCARHISNVAHADKNKIHKVQTFCQICLEDDENIKPCRGLVLNKVIKRIFDDEKKARFKETKTSSQKEQ